MDSDVSANERSFNEVRQRLNSSTGSTTSIPPKRGRRRHR
jgi:hypothetical protein